MSEWSKYLAKGLPLSQNGKAPIRQEFRELSEEQRFLYIEGLKRFQNVDLEDPLSYFQIAGIHGLPYQTWPNQSWNQDIPGRELDGPTDIGGFCTHSSILFLTWHRPYLALYESALYRHVNDAAAAINSSDPKKNEYVALAKDFRIPYWDWARKPTGRDPQIFPEQALDPNYRPKGPSLGSGDFNPLYAFNFPDDAPENIKRARTRGPFPRTVRYPGYRAPSAALERNLESLYETPWEHLDNETHERNLTERTAWILQAYDTFPAMSYNALRRGLDGKIIKDATNWGSLEDVHNAIHALVGANGHMNFPECSAFDPIFWLHHTNIDRLFAIWQAFNENSKDPNTYVVERRASTNFITTRQDTESLDSKLYPFRPDINNWYTSDDVRRVEDFGYTYPEIEGLKYPTNLSAKTALREKIGQLYASISDDIWKSKKHIKDAGQGLLRQAHIIKQVVDNKLPATVAQLNTLSAQIPPIQNLLQTSLEPSKPFLRDLAPNHKYLEWITNIKAEKHALDGNWSVHIFLNSPDETNVALWPASPSHVGTFAPFGQGNTTSCEKCQEDQREGLQISGQIPLTIALVERYLAGIIPDLSEESVVPYLTKNLHWRVAGPDGTALTNRSDLAGLVVLVVSNEVTLPENENGLPTFAPTVKVYPEITTNAQGGPRGDGTGLTADLLAPGVLSSE